MTGTCVYNVYKDIYKFSPILGTVLDDLQDYITVHSDSFYKWSGYILFVCSHEVLFMPVSKCTYNKCACVYKFNLISSP